MELRRPQRSRASIWRAQGLRASPSCPHGSCVCSPRTKLIRGLLRMLRASSVLSWSSPEIKPPPGGCSQKKADTCLPVQAAIGRRGWKQGAGAVCHGLRPAVPHLEPTIQRDADKASLKPWSLPCPLQSSVCWHLAAARVRFLRQTCQSRSNKSALPPTHPPQQISSQDGALGPSTMRPRDTGLGGAARCRRKVPHDHRGCCYYYTVALGSCATAQQHSSIPIHGLHGMELGPHSPAPHRRSLRWGRVCLGHLSEVPSRAPCYTLTPRQGSRRRLVVNGVFYLEQHLGMSRCGPSRRANLCEGFPEC